MLEAALEITDFDGSYIFESLAEERYYEYLESRSCPELRQELASLNQRLNYAEFKGNDLSELERKKTMVISLLYDRGIFCE